MVGRESEPSNANAVGGLVTTIGNDNLHLGVFVDDDDELGFIGKDIPSAIEDQEGSLSDSEGVIMKNGKVRRKLRWKPPNFRRKKQNSTNENNNNGIQNKLSSSSSVVSALTNKSSSTSRSSSTAKSFLSHFSRRSQNSFHTFHSTETPVVTNKAGRPIAPHTVQRPNYPDTFESAVTNSNQPTTIDNEGKHFMLHKRSRSDTKLETVDNPARGSFERSSRLPSRLDGITIPQRALDDKKPFNPYGSAASTNSDPFDALEDLDHPTAPPPPPLPRKIGKSKRPPLFKRKSRKSKKEQLIISVIEEGSQASSANTSAASPVAANPTAPTVASIDSPLSAAMSLERENSVLPALELEDFERDLRVFIGTPPRNQEDVADNDGTSDTDTARTPLSVHSTNASSSHHISETTTLTPTVNPGEVVSTLERPFVNSPSSRHSSPRKMYNRPVDRTASDDLISTGSNTDAGAQQAAETEETRQRRPSVPVDVDDVAFFEAEHNLRAIHDMAAEHLAHDEYEEAIDVFEEVLRAQRERYGHKHYRVGTALHNLGVVHMKCRHYKKAIAIFSEAVEIRKEALVPDHPDVAVSLAQLGVANLESGNFQMSLMPFREALNIRRAFLGPRHPKCSKLLNNIGCALFSLNELGDARIVFEEALDIQRATLREMPSSEEGQESSVQSNSILLSMASTLCNLASISLKLGKYEDAGVALEEALLIQQSVLGDEHPVVSSTIDSIEFVERSREEASMPTLSGCSSSVGSRGLGFKHNGLCRSDPRIDEVLGVNVFSGISPKNWLQRMEHVFPENAFPENACGPMNVGDDAHTEANSLSASDGIPLAASGGGYSV